MAKGLGHKIARLVSLREQGLRRGRLADADELVEFVALHQEIFRALTDQPGLMVRIPDLSQRDKTIKTINWLWADADLDKLTEEIRSDDRGGELACAFALRAKRLRPAFICVQPTPEVACCYAEAITAWLYGCDRAALILCRATIECLVKGLLGQMDSSLLLTTVRKRDKLITIEKNLKLLLETAVEVGILDGPRFKRADKIRDLANDAVHGAHSIPEADYEDAVLDTRTIVEIALGKLG